MCWSSRLGCKAEVLMCQVPGKVRLCCSIDPGAGAYGTGFSRRLFNCSDLNELPDKAHFKSHVSAFHAMITLVEKKIRPLSVFAALAYRLMGSLFCLVWPRVPNDAAWLASSHCSLSLTWLNLVSLANLFIMLN